MAKGKVTQEQAAEGKRLLSETVSLLIGLCKSVAPNRLGEETLPYRTEQRLTIKIKSRIKIKKSTRPSSLNSSENSEEPSRAAEVVYVEGGVRWILMRNAGSDRIERMPRRWIQVR